MKLFDVYPRYDINLQRAEGCWVFDDEGNKYLDLYGGHAVISIGHSHVRFVDRITKQLNDIAFYSNSVQLPIQDDDQDTGLIRSRRTANLDDLPIFDSEGDSKLDIPTFLRKQAD